LIFTHRWWPFLISLPNKHCSTSSSQNGLKKTGGLKTII
jgi:hypothetical protein